jgi:4-hydroxythreonine-4-phosphate dehydrogenase
MNTLASVAPPSEELRKGPRLALTLGDVAGIGPEVTVAAALHPDVRARCRVMLVGRPEVVERAARRFAPQVRIQSHVDWRSGWSACDPADERVLHVLTAGSAAVAEVPPGRIDARAGQGAYDALIAATDAALAGDVDAIVTAPLHQESLRLAGLSQPGHTEILAERCGAKSHAMMLHLPPGGMIQQPHGLSVAHVTLHTSIASVPGLLSVARIRDTIELLDGFLHRLGSERPRIGVCALNPHAGEHGLFGDEEARLIEPAVRAEAERGVQASGPWPADTLVRAAIVEGRYDGLVAMYHEQGHIPFKLIGFDRAVNVTLGLPIVRTSPSHGTAFDIAWQGRARSEGMRGAITTAVQLSATAGNAFGRP